jgi:hypothetical protein
LQSRPGWRLAEFLLLGTAAAVLAGCAKDATSLAADQAEATLAEAILLEHEDALSHRAADPTAVDAAAADRLAASLSGGDPKLLVSARTTGESVEVVTTVGVRAHSSGFSSADTSLGACLLTTVTPGSLTGDTGERGTVSTEPVPCPEGVVPVAEGSPVEAITTEAERLESPVPRPRTRPCHSGGSNDCESGGG